MSKKIKTNASEYVLTERYNLNPNLWGPHAWFFLENIAFSYSAIFYIYWTNHTMPIL